MSGSFNESCHEPACFFSRGTEQISICINHVLQLPMRLFTYWTSTVFVSHMLRSCKPTCTVHTSVTRHHCLEVVKRDISYDAVTNRISIILFIFLRRYLRNQLAAPQELGYPPPPSIMEITM